jgi:predicted transcriptional regulator
MAEDTDIIALTIDVVSSYVGHNNMRPDDVPAFIASTHAAIRQLDGQSTPGAAEEPAGEAYTPAVSVRKSLASRDHILSMVDGKPYKTLRRHLATHGMTPEQYRERYSLKADYPMVAPSYSETRKALAEKIGLGRKPAAAPSDTAKSKRAPQAKKATTEAAPADA